MKPMTSSAAAAAIIAASIAFTGCDRGSSPEDDDDSGRKEMRAGTGAGAELHILTWMDYIDPDIIEAFSSECSCRVIVDTFESNEAMYERLKPCEAGYDIIIPTSYFADRMAREGMLREIDRSKLPTVIANFDQSFANQILDPSFKYTVPYAVTYGGFCYMKNKMPKGEDVASWEILSNPALRGKITLLDDIRETIGGALMALGYSINSTNPSEIAAAASLVMRWRANIRKFDAETYKTEVPSGSTWIGHGYSTDSMQIILGDQDEEMPSRPDIGFVLPKEGFSIAFDEMVIPSNAAHPDLAYAFMDYMYRPEVAKANMEYILGPMPVKPGIEALSEDLRKRIILPPDVLANGQVIKAIDTVSGATELYNKAWISIKAARIK